MSKEKKKSTFWADFKKFISKGNVVDMAVGVVIGGAFGKIVTGLVNYIINPVVSLLTGSGDLDSLKTVLVPEEIVDEVVKQKEVAILWGTWIQTIIDFLIVAFCIFLVLRLITKARATLERKKIAEEEAKAAEASSKALFGGRGDDENMPMTEITINDLSDGVIDIMTALVKTGLCASKSEARRNIQQGGVSVNDEKVADISASYDADTLKNGIVIKRGKKNFNKLILK